MFSRTHNFTAGPCTLPIPVLEEARSELLDWAGLGMSVMEISHRSAPFLRLHEETLQLAQELIGAPETFMPLLLPGGGSLQFAMSAYNLLSGGHHGAIVHSGVWAGKAYAEAQRIGTMHVVWDGAEQAYTTLPEQVQVPDTARYLHLTSNETIGGIQWRQYPQSTAPLVIDASSDYYTRALPWERCAIVYGGVQKNLAPAGLALVFVRRDLLVEHPELPRFLSYKTHADANSLYNTPPTWQIYMLNKVLKWLRAEGGISEFERRAEAKSAKLYRALDASAFYRNSIAPEFRSRTNVVFKTPNPELDAAFVREAEAAGLWGLKGHRLAGGLRASLYNALTMDSVDALLSFMENFAHRHG